MAALQYHGGWDDSGYNFRSELRCMYDRITGYDYQDDVLRTVSDRRSWYAHGPYNYQYDVWRMHGRITKYNYNSDVRRTYDLLTEQPGARLDDHRNYVRACYVVSGTARREPAPRMP